MRAAEVETHDTTAAYFTRMHAFQIAQDLLKNQPAVKADPDCTAFLLTLMDRLEQDQAKVTPELIGPDGSHAAKEYMENFVLQVFENVDNSDRAGDITADTGKNFLIASNFIDVMKHFGELTPDVSKACGSDGAPLEQSVIVLIDDDGDA